MAGRLLVAVTTVVAGAALAPGPAAAGGWATVGLDPIPDGVRAGEPWVVRLTVLQHGRTPLEGVEPAVTISKAGTSRTFAAAPTGQPGVYRASVVFPSAGSWSYVVDDGFSARHTFRAVRVGERAAKDRVRLASAVPDAADREDGGGAVRLAVVVALAAGLFAAGLVLLVQRESRGGPGPPGR
jgi:hypothetical protein